MLRQHAAPLTQRLSPCRMQQLQYSPILCLYKHCNVRVQHHAAHAVHAVHVWRCLPAALMSTQLLESQWCVACADQACDS